jgi:hypothetical protein
MTDMELVEATRGAAFEVVAAAVPDFLDFVRQDTQPPFSMLGDIDFENDGSKHARFLNITLELITVYRGKDRAQLIAMMGAAGGALDDAELVAPGVEFSRPRLVSGSASGAGPDGVTFAGVQTFTLTAEPA